MSSNKRKYHARKDSLGEVGKTVKMVREGPQGVGNVLQGGGTSGTNFWLVDFGNYGSNGDIGHIHGFSETNQGEARATNIRRDMGDSQGRSSMVSGNNSV